MLVGGARELELGTYRIEIESPDLISGVAPTGAFKRLWDKLAVNCDAAKSFIESHGIIGVDPAILTPCLKTLVGKRIIELYVHRCLEKLNASAVIIGPVPGGVKGGTVQELNTSHGIYGMYTNAENMKTKGYRSFNSLPWAVAGPFVDACVVPQ